MAEEAKNFYPFIGEPSVLITFVSGGISGGISRTVTAPLDRIKIMMQSEIGKTSIKQTIEKILRKSNYLSFWKGNGTNVIKIMPETALKFYSFEYMRNILQSSESDFGKNLISGAVAGATA